MRLIFKIAFRNLFRHKGRSISIGFVIITGAFFMTLTNGIIAGMQNGLERNLVKSILGDITLLSMERRDDNLSSSPERIGFLENYQEIKNTIDKQEYVNRFTPMIFGDAALLDLSMVQSQATGIDTIQFFGMDFETYRNIYSNIIDILEGSSLSHGEKGILINAEFRERIYDLHDIWLLPEDGSIVKENLMKDALANINNLKTRSDLVLMGMNGTATSTDVRVPIKGIFKYRHMNGIFSRDNLIDIETSRECMGYITTEEMITDLSDENQKLLDIAEEGPNILFFEDDMFENEELGPMERDYVDTLKQDSTDRKPYNSDNGIYSLAQINLKPGINLEEAVSHLNSSFAEAGLNEFVRAVSWKDAWSVFWGYISIFRISLMVFAYIIYFAAVLMMANAFSMAALERATELATMRTVGSQKGFISGMFVTETSLLSFIFGGLGMVVGVAIIKYLARMNIKITGNILQILFGGSRFCPLINLSTMMTGVIQLGIITLIAIIYPIIVARRIRPIDAITKD
jgi:ABC-type lipoprotein release transport system permease subunit